MRERLLYGVNTGQRECARIDNEQYVIKGIANAIHEKACLARVFSEAISRFHNGELATALLRQRPSIFFATTEPVGVGIGKIRSAKFSNHRGQD